MILVTGATGHIGNVLVRDILSQGERIRVMLLPNENSKALDGLDVERVQGNVLDIETLRGAMDGIKIVYHLAGIISIMPRINDLLYRVNVLGTQNVIKACFEKKVRRLVYTSSIHAITRIPKGQVIDEAVPFDAKGAVGEYDRTKALASLSILRAVEEGLDATIVCPTGVVGPFDFNLSEMGNLILDCVQKRQVVFIDGAYDFVDVRDVARGLIQAAEKGKRGESYILSGERVTVEEIFNLVKEVSGIHKPGIKLPLWVARAASTITPYYYRITGKKPRITPYSLETLQSNSQFSHAKAREMLGYNPRSLRISIADTIEWFKKAGWFPPRTDMI
jgi:dihydroflavonol-4-reductase